MADEQQVGHVNQVDGLDAEIAEMEAAMKGGESQQPEVDPEQEFQQGDQSLQQQQGDQPLQPPVQEGIITSVDEFIEAEKKPQEQSQEQAPPPEVPLEANDQQPEQGTVEQQQQSGRRSWKTDYLELENRYTRLRQANDHFKFETRQQLAQLQEELLQTKELNDKLAIALQDAEQKVGTGVNMASMFSEEDRDVLGETTISSFEKAVNTAVEAATNPLRKELLVMKKSERSRLKSQAESNRTEASSTFERRLLELVPDFQTTNRDKGFIDWLNNPSPYSGVSRMTHLHKAESAGDIERVAQFFVEYKQMQEAPQQLLNQNITPSGEGGGGSNPATLQQQQQQPGERIFSMDFVNKFYDDDIAGVYDGREALRDQLDREIDQALQDGRVR